MHLSLLYIKERRERNSYVKSTQATSIIVIIVKIDLDKLDNSIDIPTYLYQTQDELTHSLAHKM